MTDGRTPERDYLKGLTALYVEDDDDTRDQFSLFLRRLMGGLNVAKDGQEGLESYRKAKPDLVITDITMPNMDGLEMAKRIREFDAKIPIIILTAYEELDYLKRSINIGVDKYLNKPIKSEEIQETLLACARELQLEETLHAAALTDPLTGLSNRLDLKNRFESEKSRAERHGAFFSAVMADIDFFKKVNDTYGHNAGDLILKNVAAAMRCSMRKEDICGRWGGEEFLAFLPDTALDAAMSAAEKLRSAVENMKTDWEGKPVSVTISLGVSEFCNGMTMEECIQSADAALYRAKETGRNRCMAAQNRK